MIALLPDRTRIAGMTGDQLKAWRKRLTLNQNDAAAELGVSRRSIQGWETEGREIPRSVELACAALELGLRDYHGEPLELRAGPLTVKGGK